MALVGHGDLGELAGAARGHRHLGVRVRVVDRIGDEVGDGRRQQLPVPEDGQSRLGGRLDHHAVRLRGHADPVDGLTDD